jgi:hypothetical protein
LITFKR